MIKVKRLDSKAIIPVKAKDNDSGYDICSSVNIRIPVNKVIKVPTGLAFQAPEGYELQVRPRSGLSSKGVVVILGTVDNGYRGEVQVIVANKSNEIYSINEGDKIAQIVPVAIPHFEIIEVDELSDTVRGSNGFGSTGLNTKTEQVDYISELHDKGLFSVVNSDSKFSPQFEINNDKKFKEHTPEELRNRIIKSLHEYMETDKEEKQNCEQLIKYVECELEVDNSGIDSRVPKVVNDV